MFFLNESKNNDSRRTINFYKKLKENPFKFHKKKNYFFWNTIDVKNSQNNNSELLFCQKENDKIIKSYRNIMKNKSRILDKNQMNYLNYLAKEKERKFFTNNKNKFKNVKNFNPSNYFKIQPINDNSSVNNNIKSFSFSPKYLKSNGSDVTNPNYFDNIAKKLIMKKNAEILNYNTNAFKLKYNSNIHRNNYFLKKNLPLPPGKINNPRYYLLGESKLERNPIVNPGNRCNSPDNNNFKRKKSEFHSI